MGLPLFLQVHRAQVVEDRWPDLLVDNQPETEYLGGPHYQIAAHQLGEAVAIELKRGAAQLRIELDPLSGAGVAQERTIAPVIQRHESPVGGLHAPRTLVAAAPSDRNA